MNTRVYFSSLFLSIFVVSCFANMHNLHTTAQAWQLLSQQLSCYMRPFTYLEIIESEPLWAFDIARTYPKSSVVVLVVGSDSDKLVRRLKQERSENIIVLHPKLFGLYELEMLGLCESIDQLVLPDLSVRFDQDWQECIEAVSRIAPNSMMQAASFVSCQYDDSLKSASAQSVGCKVHSSMTRADASTRATRFWRSRQHIKRGIMLSRWPTDQLDLSTITFPEDPPYAVMSSYDTKLLHKSSCENPQMMVPGINLKTFVMLRGIWPEDAVLIEKIRLFETSITHNDLVENNLMISGTTIVPIDTDDLRWCGDLSLCVIRILSLFKDRLRFDDPRAAIKRLDTYGCITLETAQKHQQMIQNRFSAAVTAGTVLSSTWIGVEPMTSRT